MTAAMPQPQKMSAADYRELADFIDAEAVRARLAAGGLLSPDCLHLQKTAKYLRGKAAGMELKS